MASSYVNDLRLNEMATGDQSGTWGNTTNTNLELIAEAFGFGTEGITTNADTHTSTIADGATDPVRAHYVKYTGTLDSACTITIAPNTVNRFHIIENGTSGSQNIIISQGSGSNVTIAAGTAKAVYLDGAGSGAAVTDAFSHLAVVDLTVDDDLIVTDDISLKSDGAVINFGADSEIKLTHSADNGLILKHDASGDDKFSTLTLQTGDTDIAVDDVLGRILFQAPDEGAGTDAITSSARIQAISEGDFSASSNVTSLEFRTASSGVVGTAGQGSKLTLTSDFQLQLKSMSTADGSSPIFELQTGETAVETNDILGSISWKAPDESGGTDAITQAAFILARAGADFTSSSNDTNLQFGTGLSGAASTRMTIDSDGSVSIEDGNLVFASGHGLDFSNSTNSGADNSSGNFGELLDDYEQGNFNLTMIGVGGSAGSVAGNVANMTYVKIGNMVMINGSPAITNVGSYSGSIRLTGLPFANGANHSFGTQFTWHNFNSRNDASANIYPYGSASQTYLSVGTPDTGSVAWSTVGTGYYGIGGVYPTF